MADRAAGTDRTGPKTCWCGKDHWGDLLAALHAHPPTPEEWAEAEAWADSVLAAFEPDELEDARGS